MSTTVTIPTPGSFSKKLSAAVAAVIIVVLNDKLGWGISPQTVEDIVAVVIGYVVGQGIADFGKEKAKVEMNGHGKPPTPPAPGGAS